MRWVMSALEVGGLALMVYGLWLIYPPLAFITLGLGMVGVAGMWEWGRGRGAPPGRA